MIRPPKVSEVLARYDIKLVNCDSELGHYRYCDNVLLLDTRLQPWSEFFIRANIVTLDTEWRLFVAANVNTFNCIIYGNNRLPINSLSQMLKASGLIVNLLEDTCYYCK